MKRTQVCTYRSLAEAPAILTLEETARLLRITYDGVRSRVFKGTLPGAFKCGQAWRVDKEVLIESFGTRQSVGSPTGKGA